MLRLSQSSFTLAFLTFLTSTLLWASVISHQLQEECEFDYIGGSNKGPTKWGAIKREWANCNYGKMQSPIDLSTKTIQVVNNMGQLNKRYIPFGAILKNRGHDVSVGWEGNAGSIEINGTQYFLKQTHWHSPSEHTINGKRYDLELHVVHQSSNPNAKYPLAVVSFLYEIGPPDSFLSKVSREIKELSHGKKNQMKLGSINPNEIRRGGINYYRYVGSLTVPPCTEGVIWSINKQIGTVSQEQVMLLRSVVEHCAEKNARPIQPLNGRQVVQLYDPNP
ncbi:alpha carbonic anhydrase 7-like [Cucumis melo var. makuwa]|uniref:Carbonic anhydrase n=1 Tax=Cucumis melo var. makuwa TaxID=1194695 RepID=A0A5D3DNH9_CUCMM|nr:alpha carbonic anhydrase 7-like [Cucumis melo var. makuwa]